MTQNIELFNDYVAIILSRLYENFPVKIDIHVRDITVHRDTTIASLLGEHLIFGPDGKELTEGVIAYSTIEWLVENDFVNASASQPKIRYFGCTLTISGLTLLNSTPDSLKQGDETFGESLVRLLGEGSTDAARGMVTQLLTFGLC